MLLHPSPCLPSKPAAAPDRAALAAFAWLAFAFAVVYASSLAFVYVEGDDAATIAYHVLGRNPLVQPPHALYQCMADSLLAFLPPFEPLLRIVALSVSALGAFLFAAGLVFFSDRIWPSSLTLSSPLNALALTLLCPELFYLGLVYSPAVLAMGFLLAAHLLLRARPSPFGYAASVILFGFGAAFRWDTAAYGLVIVADLFLRSRRPFLPLAWGASALLSWLAFVRLCGVGLPAVLSTLTREGPLESPNLVLAAVALQPLLTPAFCLFFLAGLYTLLRGRSPALWLLLAGLLPVLHLLPLGVPKWFIVAIPALAATALTGLRTTVLWISAATGRRRLAWAACLALALLPWAAGLRLSYADSAWGPGFEIRPYDRPPTPTQFRLSLGSGAAAPTPEGPRPLGGHAAVLLAGRWRAFAQLQWDHESSALRAAMRQGLPLVHDDASNLPVVALAALGYATSDPGYASFLKSGAAPPPLIRRRFTSVPGSREVLLLALGHPAGAYTPAQIRLLASASPSPRIVLAGFPGTLRRLYLQAQSAFTPINETSATVDLFRARQLSSPFDPAPLARIGGDMPSTTAVLIGLALQAGAATLYVSPSGDDQAPGTSDAPFRTIQRAVDSVSPGDTILVRDGTYTSSDCSTGSGYVVTLHRSGTPSAWITLKAENRWGAILDARNTCHSSIRTDSASYWVIEGFRLVNGYYGGLTSNPDAEPGADFIDVRSNEFANIGQRFVTRDAIVGAGANSTAQNWSFRGNVFHDIGRTGPTAMMVYDHGLYLRSQDTVIVNNVFYGPISGWAIQTAAGFSGLIANNTFHGDLTPAREGHIMLWGANLGVTIRNNVFSQPGGRAIVNVRFSSSSCSIDNNLVFGAPSVGTPWGCSESNNRLDLDPSFVNVATAPFDFHLLSLSPAIDAGLPLDAVPSDFDGVQRPQGAAPDLGAYEYIPPPPF